MSNLHDRSAETLRAWDLAAGKYAEMIEVDVAALLSGGPELSPPEREALLPLVSRSTRLLHLQCSHGQTALGLWRATGCEVVGVDGSAAMLAIAREKARRLEASTGHVRFVQADVLAPPTELAGCADVLLTGSGALPWVGDLTRWGQVVARLLAPDGWLVLYEGHPLNWVWDRRAERVQFRSVRSYFDVHVEPNDDFPARAVERFAPGDAAVPRAWEHQWTLGQIVTAVATAGLRIERLVEYPVHFWPEFPRVPESELTRLPHSFLLVARRPERDREVAASERSA
jgi:SAM-dependent methyltransferase